MSIVSAPIARSTIKANLDDFSHAWRKRIDGWKESAKGATEKSAAQQFWSDLFRCFGIIPERIDLFERDAVRASTGRSGWIDLFWSGVVLGEAKSLGRNLDVAHKQALDYLAGGSIGQHEWPKYVIVSDFENIRLTRLGDEGWVETFTIDEIGNYLDQLRFLAGYETITKQEEEEASIEASHLMAKLFTAMAGDDVDEATGDEAPTDPDEEDEATQRSSMYLTRLLFLLYGDDAGLWEEDLFYRFVLNHTNADNLGSQLNSLFEILNTPENHRRRVPDHFAKFPYVNGSIFADSLPQEFFDHDMREALLDACRFHWSRISPAVFGSMFQLVKSKEARRADGEHYTSEKNILKTIEPLFLDELRDEARRLIQAKSTPVKKLREFRDSLADMVFCDPACGCGNFLVVAYRELRKIETDVIVAIREREGQSGMALDVSWEQKLSIGQFHGFELNWWPAKIAETAMFLVDHQANRELADAIGAAPDRLPIEITAHIHHGNALRMDWSGQLPEVPRQTFVFGNPPFIGARLMSEEQKQELNAVWEGVKGTNQLDYVTGWHAQAMRLFEKRAGSFAFVTTNSIVQGDQTARLFGSIFGRGWRIRFAHRTFKWDSEAPGKAAVHCVIVGFDRHQSTPPKLWDYPSHRSEGFRVDVNLGINAYLVDGPNVLVESRRTPLSPVVAPAVFGSMPNDGGHLVPKAGTPRPLHDPIAMKYVTSFVGAQELIQGHDRWCFWFARDSYIPMDIIDSPVLQTHVEAVKQLRSSSKREATQKLARTPHLFGEIRQPTIPYVAIPRHVSESRPYWTAAQMGPGTICGDSNMWAEDPEGLQFALISSSMFITWQRTVGGRIKSDLRFANTLTWNTFPVPDFEITTRQKIIDAGQGIVKARELYPERSLADHYNPLAMDPALVRAHDALDRVVDRAFGAPRKLTTERQRQELLFASYARMTHEG